MIPFGTVGTPSATMGYRNNDPHAVVVIKETPTGNIWIAHVTHSSDYYAASVKIKRKDISSAFREKGGPLTDEEGVLGLVEVPDIPCHVVATPISPSSYSVNGVLVTMENVVNIPENEQIILQNLIRTSMSQFEEKRKREKENQKRKKIK